MSILSIFGFGQQAAAVVILDAQLPSGLPQEHTRLLDAILSGAGVKVARPAHTILSPGSRDRSKLMIAKMCEHYFSQTLGSAYDENRLTITPFVAPEAGTSGVVVSHP